MFAEWPIPFLLAAVAIGIDRVLGDPRFPPHPVLLIGRWIQRLERWLYPTKVGVAALKWRGGALVLLVIAPVFTITLALVALAYGIHPWAGYALEAWLIATTIAGRGLQDAAYDVYRPLVAGDLNLARQQTGEIVGRDTEHLDEPELVRATVETVAENTVDGFTAPLLFAFVGGAPLALVYRAVNTLDSMVGYKNDKYEHFGWASARLDDVLNWIPARLTGVILAAVCLFDRRLSASRAFRAMFLFARRHPSPNSGYPEAAAAGALGIELGGVSSYGGVKGERSRLGWPLQEKSTKHIRLVVRLLGRVRNVVCGGLLCVFFVCLFVL